jgi:hypothetical protein
MLANLLQGSTYQNAYTLYANLLSRSEIKNGIRADDDDRSPSMERDLAGIDGAPKSLETMTVRPDDLQNQQMNFNGFGYRSISYHPSTNRKHARAPSPRPSYTRSHSNAHSVSQGSLSILAETALATPPTSMQHSGHVYSSGVSSALAPSPEKSLQLDADDGIQSTQLLKSLKSVAKELGVLSEHDRERIFMALRPAAQEVGMSDSAKSKKLSRKRRLPAAQELTHAGRPTSPYDSGLSDGQDGRTDSASEEEDVLKGLAFIASISTNPANSKDGSGWREGKHSVDKQKAKSSGSVKCPYDCGVVKRRQCDMKYVPVNTVQSLSLRLIQHQ